MSRLLKIFVFTCLPFTLMAGKIKAHFDHKTFYHPEQGVYLETYLQISAVSLEYVEAKDGGIKSDVEVSQVFLMGDSIVSFEKYIISSPPSLDSAVEDLLDIRKFLLPPGEYTLELTLTDLNKKGPGAQETSILYIEVNDLGQEMLSGLLMLQDVIPSKDVEHPFFRSGNIMLPHLTYFYPSEVDKLVYYLDLVNTQAHLGQEGTPFVIKQSVRKVGETDDISALTRMKRMKAHDGIEPYLGVIDISSLPTGSYELSISLMDGEQNLLSQRNVNFERSANFAGVMVNDFQMVDLTTSFTSDIPRDSVMYYLQSHLPISSRAEDDNIIKLYKDADTNAALKYIHRFWVVTAGEKDPVVEWRRYKAQVDHVEETYGTRVKTGYQSDRGRVYLQYGAPVDIHIAQNEPSTYPYEIWTYDKIGNFSNRQFVFYDRSLLNEDFELLHSDMLGELQNRRWRVDLTKRNNPNNNLDDNDGTPDHFGGGYNKTIRN